MRRVSVRGIVPVSPTPVFSGLFLIFPLSSAWPDLTLFSIFLQFYALLPLSLSVLFSFLAALPSFPLSSSHTCAARVRSPVYHARAYMGVRTHDTQRVCVRNRVPRLAVLYP